MEKIRKACSDLIETDVDDETIIVQLDNGQMYSVEGTARAIWRELDAGPTRDTLISALAEQFDMERAALEPDVDRFLHDARSAGIVTS